MYLDIDYYPLEHESIMATFFMKRLFQIYECIRTDISDTSELIIMCDKSIEKKLQCYLSDKIIGIGKLAKGRE